MLKSQPKTARQGKAGSQGWLMVAAGASPLLLFIILGAVYRAEVIAATIRFSEWLRVQGSSGALVYVLAFAGYMILCGPSTPIELVGGFCYPFISAFLLNTAAKWLGSVSCFVIGRYFSRAAKQYLGGGGGGGGGGEPSSAETLLKLLQTMLQRNEAKALVLARFAYAPMPIKNYGMGALTTVGLWPFAWTCLVGDL